MKFFFSFLFSLFYAEAVLPQAGMVKEGEFLASKILSAEMKYSVYLPADYNTSSRSYPVLYLLHGLSDNENAWLQFGKINYYAEDFFGAGNSPFIIVMPDAGRSFYINSYDKKCNYENYFINEFIPHIEKRYRVRADRKFRAVAGLSMGGYGAMVYGLKYPEKFVAAIPLSAAIRTNDQIVGMNDQRYEAMASTKVFGPGLKGEQRLNETWLSNSVIQLIKDNPIDELKQVSWYIDCGDEDELLIGNIAAHNVLRERGVAHEFRVRDGGHEWSYWRTALPGVFNFLDKTFSR